MTDKEPLRSVPTNTFPALLEELNISLLVATYQAGKLVALRADDGVLITHFRSFAKPMGLALRGPQLAIGTQHEVWGAMPTTTSLRKWNRC